METVCVIGGGAAGCVLSLRLARKGIRVIVLESGPRYSEDDKQTLFQDIFEGRKSGNAYRLKENRIETFRNNGEVPLPLAFERVRAVGGTTLFWLGNSPRMLKADFKMRSTFGLAEDWPISYDDIEPYYGQAETEIGIAGVEDNPFAERRSTSYPMPPIPFSYADKVLKQTTDKLGIEFHHTPQARNSVPYDGRSQCLACAKCTYCPINARATFDITHGVPAEATGLVKFITNSTTLRLELDSSGKVKRAIYAGLDRVERAQEADLFVICCGGIETPRLLLLSKSSLFPDGLANRTGLVGKFLMNHPIAQVSARVDEQLYPFRVSFESTESFQFYATNTRSEIAAFLMNMNNSDGVGGTPAAIARESRLWGDELLAEIKRQFGHTLSISAGVDQLPDEKNTVTLDPYNRDYFGQPIPLVTYSFDDYTQRGWQKAAEVERMIMQAAGATEIDEPGLWWPGHHLGTTRMGDDPAKSVVNADLRAHDVPNLYLVTTGCWVTGGAANPTLTLAALALRAAEHIAAGARSSV
jgi:choline dehydrogenase-like flavoprotein